MVAQDGAVTERGEKEGTLARPRKERRAAVEKNEKRPHPRGSPVKPPYERWTVAGLRAATSGAQRV